MPHLELDGSDGAEFLPEVLLHEDRDRVESLELYELEWDDAPPGAKVRLEQLDGHGGLDVADVGETEGVAVHEKLEDRGGGGEGKGTV